MNNISLFENLFAKLLKWSYEFIEDGKRPKVFLIGGIIPNENEFYNEVDQLNKPSRRIKRIIKLTQNILELWVSDIKNIEPTDEIRCIRIDKDYRVWVKTPRLTVNEWEEITPNVRACLIEDLIKLANNINGYCGQPDPFEENDKPNAEPQLSLNSHSYIFAGNGYQIWEQYRKELKITNSDRTDVRFIYEALKFDKLIHKTVGEKDFRDWMAGTYDIVMDKMPFTGIKQASNKGRMALYQSIKDNKV